MTEPRPRFEVAQILREHGEAFLSRYPVTPVQRKAIRAMVACRTAALGGHLDRCTHCDYTQPSYNSCRHRACPKCQGQRQREWIAKQAADGYFVGDFEKNVIDAGGQVWSGWGFPSFSAETAYSKVVLPALAAGKSIGDVTSDWQAEILNEAQVQGYTVTR